MESKNQMLIHEIMSQVEKYAKAYEEDYEMFFHSSHKLNGQDFIKEKNNLLELLENMLLVGEKNR